MYNQNCCIWLNRIILSLCFIKFNKRKIAKPNHNFGYTKPSSKPQITPKKNELSRVRFFIYK
jgi:hypothetical protein